jgi:hypothetical protein
VSFASVTFTVQGQTGSGSADATPPSIIIYNPIPNSSQGPYSFTTLNGRADDSFGVSLLQASLYQTSSGLFWNNSVQESCSKWFVVGRRWSENVKIKKKLSRFEIGY